MNFIAWIIFGTLASWVAIIFTNKNHNKIISEDQTDE